MYKSTYTGYDKVRCLERIVMDNQIGKGLGITNGRNGNGIQRLALESIVNIGGKEAVEGLKRLIAHTELNRELKTYASQLLEMLVSHNKNKKVEE